MKHQFKKNRFFVLIALLFTLSANAQEYILPDDLAFDVVDEFEGNEGIDRSCTKKYDRLCVKNQLTAKRIRACDVNILGTLTVDGCVIDPCRPARLLRPILCKSICYNRVNRIHYHSRGN